MIVGNGMLAQAFNEYNNNNRIVIFASGVSNSSEKEEQAFQREIDLVKRIISKNKDKLFIYFSTCSMYDPLSKDTSYVQHKLQIEKMISSQSDNFLILRVSQVFGRSKNATLLNFLFEKIEHEKQFDLWKNSNRNIISLNDIVRITNQLIKEEKYNQIFHIANKVYIDIPDLIQLIEKVLNKKAICSLVDKGQKYQIIPNDIESIVDKLNITFGDDYYFKNLLTFNQSNTE